MSWGATIWVKRIIQLTIKWCVPVLYSCNYNQPHTYDLGLFICTSNYMQPTTHIRKVILQIYTIKFGTIVLSMEILWYWPRQIYYVDLGNFNLWLPWQVHIFFNFTNFIDLKKNHKNFKKYHQFTKNYNWKNVCAIQKKRE